MSQQYQRFKHSFFREHPPQQNYHLQCPQTKYELHNNYQPTSNDKDRMMRNQSDDNLRIQEQSQYPFQEMQHPTFNEVTDNPFLVYGQKDIRRQQKFSLMHTNNNSLGLNYQDLDLNDNFSTRYKVNSQFPQKLQVNREFPEKKQGFKRQEGSDNLSLNRRQVFDQPSYQKGGKYIEKQQQQIQKINQQLQRLRVQSRSQEQKYVNFPSQNITIHPQPEQSHYINEINDSRNNITSSHQMAVSPQRQLPVIYNKSQVSTTNSISKMNSPPPISPNNSRIIIQHSPQMQGRPSTLISMGNAVQSPPTLLPQQLSNSQSHYVQNPIINPTNSSSKLLIHSQTINNNPPPHFINRQVLPPHNNQVIHLPIPQSPPVIKFSDSQVNQYTQSMIPLKQYQHLRNQCIMWQQKYYQNSENLIKFQSQSNHQFNHVNQQQFISLQQQNNRLKDKIQKLENNDKLSHDKIKQTYHELITQYEDSLTKQCQLLVDRFRLQMKHNSRT